MTRSVDIVTHFNIWNLFQIALHQNFRFWNSLLQLFLEDFNREIEVWIVFVKPKVVSNICVAVFLKPKVVSRNISVVWVVFVFLGMYHGLKIAVFWPKFTISKVSFQTPYSVFKIGQLFVAFFCPCWSVTFDFWQFSCTINQGYSHFFSKSQFMWNGNQIYLQTHPQGEANFISKNPNP